MDKVSADNTEEVAGVLALQLYDESSCRAIIECAERAGAWGQATVSVRDGGGRFRAAAKPKTRLAAAFTPPADWALTKDFDRKLDGVIKPLVNRVWRTSLTRHAGTHVVRYVPGEFYAEHTDVGLNLLDRYFTVLCYLNDDFDGGQTSFPRLNYSVTPRCGKVLIFPATYVHGAEPVTRGEKYILVSWLMGTFPIKWI